MDKADTDFRFRIMMQQQIKRVVANKGTCRIGYRAGDSRVLNGLRHLRHGNCGKNTVRSIGDDPLLHRLVARVVRKARAADVDANALRRHRAAAAGLSHA